MSLGTLFTRAKPIATPSPAIVANIARIEAEANSAPQDVNKQLALFQALIDTKAKAGYDLLVTRWERMCEFVSDHSDPVLSTHNGQQDPHSPLLRSDVAFQLYCTALVNTGLEASIAPAVRRRESLLALSTAPTSTQHSTAESNESVKLPSLDPSPLPTSRSHQIAQGVLAGNASATTLSDSVQVGGKTTPDMAQLVAALGSGAGNAGNPIFVTVSDREFNTLTMQAIIKLTESVAKGATVFRIVRFVSFTLLGGFCEFLYSLWHRFVLIFDLVLLVVFSVLLENSGLLKAGPRQSEYEPLQHNTVKFSDVHGCDEVKEVSYNVLEQYS